MVSLRDLFVVELSDLLDAEQQILRELPLMASRATAPELREVFEDHYRDTHRHVERLESLFEQMDERPRPSICHGVRGLVEEARERHGLWPRGEVLDAALIGTALRVEHYEIAAYGCARTYAGQLGYPDAARTLQRTLDEEGRAESRLTALTRRGLMERSDTAATSGPSPTSLMPGVWVTEAAGFASVPPRAESDLRVNVENELMIARGEPDWRSFRADRDQRKAGGLAMKERERNEDARGGDVIVNDSIASGRPELPTDRTPNRGEMVVNPDELGSERSEEVQPPEKNE
jgi:ferritin-like metal-binding protein YciE